jgi:hypothetical protein
MITKPVSNEDKLAWCEHGAELEKQFVAANSFSGVQIRMNPIKNVDKYTHDLMATFQADLKSIKTPFRTADRYGIPPSFAITLNEKDINRYKSMYPNIIIFFDIDYPEYKGVRMAPLSRIFRLMDLGKAKRHEYINRMNDSGGNAKASYVFDYRWFDEVKK